MRQDLIAVVSGLCLVAACTPLTPQPFAVTSSAETAPPGTMFRSNDPNINDVQAKGFCADGYEKLDESVQPSDGGNWTEWHVRCTPYHVTIF